MELKDEFLEWAWRTHRATMKEMWRSFERQKFNYEEE